MKRKLFWILYFGISATAIVLVAVLMPQYVIFTKYSYFPAAYIGFMILLALFFPSKLCAKLSLKNINRRLLYHHRIVPTITTRKEILDWQRFIRRDQLCISKVLVAFIPLVASFIPFFGNTAKTYCFLLCIPICSAMAVYTSFVFYKEIQKENQKRQQERKEQELREELGRWK